MPADRPHAAVRLAPPGDGGFTLVEVLVAIVVIGVVMSAVAPFLVQSVVVVSQQRDQQVAVQVANDALERARALRGASLLTGRDEQATADQWALGTASAEVKPYLDGMARDWDHLAVAGNGLKASLPTSPNPVTIGGVVYQQNWYVGRCWQAKADSAQAKVTVGDCLPATSDPTDAPFFRIVVAVTWPQKSCTGGCVYVASTLVSIGVDAIFDLNQPPVTITDPANQSGYVTVAASLQIIAKNGQLPRTWTATGLPPGLTISSGGGLISGVPTTAGVYTVHVTVADFESKTDDSTFTWTVVPLLTSPVAQVGEVGVASTLTVPRAVGLPSLAWSATGLPTGLLIDAATGVISGVPTTARAAAAVTVTVVVAGIATQTASVTFTWKVVAAVALANPGSFSATKGDPGTYNLAPLASGGLVPYTWQSTTLPLGLTLNSTNGAVSGTIANGTRYLATIVVTDSVGATASVTVLVNVAQRYASDLRVTAPAPITPTPDRTTIAGTAVSLVAGAAGGTPASYAWTATNLPPPLTVSPAGAITGTPTTKGTYIVTLTVTGAVGEKAILMFTWTVT
jgi:prepilin-type N-terminal cleavage/methylation domain-containing protein